jgi:hypothetical protein
MTCRRLFFIVVAVSGGLQATVAQEITTISRFTNGSRAGQVQDYTGFHSGIPVGSPCHDGGGSTGVGIPISGGGADGPSLGRH